MWRDAQGLARSAAAREPRAVRLPPLLFFTDPVRTPDPVSIAQGLPTGAAIVFRHFGRPDALDVAAALAQVARRRGLFLLIGADAPLAQTVGAHGVHLPERRAADAVLLRRRRPRWLITAAAHGARSLVRAATAGVDAAVLSPMFDSHSASAGRPLGPLRTALLVRAAHLPVYGLGGVSDRTIARLRGTGLVGVAAVDALRPADPQSTPEKRARTGTPSRRGPAAHYPAATA